ncbi:anti-phage protein Ppl [Cronobacter sakazakii]|uniref:anti-phage protein Ppl n=1 Tax=Cronobacter sakazakii TaxID=28141 RepID=UPI002894B663|nr:anti-phage protein Ppl [Cronobacter sakazakii]MDT3632316.1 anti-phage protein Ppl [Cronobacter sakazakii]
MTVGSRWFKFDFHNHTPASDDYRVPDLQPREWLLAYMRQQVDCVVISDHNSGAWIDVLKAELANMSRDASSGELADFRPLTLFPGVELTATGNVHILAVLHTQSTSAEVERLLAQCNNNYPISRETPNHELVLQLGPAGIISNIRRNPEAVCILAHIDAAKGVLTSLTNQGELTAAFQSKPHAVEIRHREEEITNGAHRRLIADLPWLRGSDAHHPEQAGVRTCWLKMSAPDFDGLRHALLDPENCVLFDDNPPEAPASHLRSLTFRTRLCQPADQNGAFVEFSPFYNAVIGSRGSGKSTLIESIRLAMRKTEGLTVSQNNKLNQFSQTGMGMDADSFIECVFRKEGTDFRLSWRPGGRHELHMWSDGEWVPDTHWSADRFPLSIYSQKMLYELASDTGAFLRVCDDSPRVNKRAWNERWDQLERDYLNEQLTLRGLRAKLVSAGTLQGELSDAQRAVSQLQSSAYYPVCNRLAQAKAELSAATLPLEHYEERIDNLQALAAETQPLTVTLQAPSGQLTEFMARLSSVQQQYDQHLCSLLSECAAALDSIRREQAFTALGTAVSDQEAAVESEAIALREQGLNPDVLNDLMARIESLQHELRNYDGLDGAIAASVTRSELLITQMREHRMTLTNNRKAFISSLSLSALEIKILPLCAPHDDIVSGYQAVTGINNFAERIYDSGEGSGLLHDFISQRPFSPLPAATENKYSALDELKALHHDIRLEASGAGAALHGTFRNRLRSLTDQQMDALQCWYPDDGIHIRYQTPGGGMEDISSASPGQKGASMLQFLLSYGTDPLLLDQPEDDLDCLMLSMSVIPAIMANKKRRQLIIVSHSAPIVVNGDAEYVISMQHDRSGLYPGLCGALQEMPLKALICRQMEGGEKAFRSRYERILS